MAAKLNKNSAIATLSYSMALVIESPVRRWWLRCGTSNPGPALLQTREALEKVQKIARIILDPLSF